MTSPSLPWGRLVLLTKTQRGSLPGHYDLSRSKHCIGRVAKRCDIHIPKHFISALHCIIRLQGKDSCGQPVVDIEDLSRNGVWVNIQKVGARRKTQLKRGYVIHFTAPDTTDVSELAYKLEILSCDELDARSTADEIPRSGRTRKRAHEELQCTQSPTKITHSPPLPRPVKKLRHAINSQKTSREENEPVGEPASELGNTPTTQHSSGPSTRTAGERCHRVHVPAAESKLVELEKKHDQLIGIFTKNALALDEKSKQLEQAQKELEALREENETLKKSFEQSKIVKDEACN
ncbi:hypothetical protein PInf_024120 [Phytophthora infestans]|nr:hypothetical protein PInf_024120 [Phytophthora infestans]